MKCKFYKKYERDIFISQPSFNITLSTFSGETDLNSLRVLPLKYPARFLHTGKQI